MKRLACCLFLACLSLSGCADVPDSEKQPEDVTQPDECKPVNCDGLMVCLQNDSHHCGSCGHACDDGEICKDSDCVAPPDGTSEPPECTGKMCDGVCVDIETDKNHCGDCGHVCGAGMICKEQKCACETSDLVQCKGMEACIDVKTDSENCGECGHVCGEGQFCNAGNCSDKEPQPAECSGAICDGVCVDVKTDNHHCGECGHACGAGQVCSDKKCVCENPGLVQCSGGDSCIDLKTDNKNCGKCGHACGNNQSCIEGVCKDTAETPCEGTVCDNMCVDIKTDNKHCGGCGYACGSGLHCENMNCACDDKNLTKCAYNTCVDVKTDTAHCGKCNNPCSGTCTNGVCSTGTPPTQEEGAGEVTGLGKNVIEYARKYLFTNTHMCTYDLFKTGTMPTLLDLTNDAGNYGYDSECANFASSVLIDTGELTQKDFSDAPQEKYRETVPAFLDLCTRGAQGYHFLDDPRKAQAGDIWISYGNDGEAFRHHVELIIKVEGDYFWQIGSNNYASTDTVECLNNHNTDSKYSSDPTKYQRVTEHKRHIDEQKAVRVICSKR